MAEELSESRWSTFAKKRDLDDASLVKALKSFDKTDLSKPEPRADALGDVITEIKKLIAALPKRKPPLPDKEAREVKDKLYDLMGEAEKLQKEARAAKEAGGDDEEESPVLLTTKMVPLLRELRKGEARMHAMVCLAGKETAVLIMRRPISPGRRKLLAEAVTAQSGFKYAVGEVFFENKALTFVFQAAAGGMAKRLRQALLNQTAMRVLVRVRGDDGEDSDGSDDEGDEGDQGLDDGATGGNSAPDIPEPPGQSTAEALAYTQRLKKVSAALAEALKAQHPEATKLRALMGFASEKAAAGDHAAAIKALVMIEQLLAARPKPPGKEDKDEAGDKQARVDPALAFNSRLAALMPAIKQALAEAGPNAEAIKRRVTEAGGLARERGFDQAHGLLDEIEALLSGPNRRDDDNPPDDDDAPPPGTPSLAEQRIFMLTRWKKIPGELKAELDQLRKSIISDDADDDPHELVDGISSYLDDLLDTVQDELDAAINQGDVKILQGLVDRVTSNPMMDLIVSSPFIDGQNVKNLVVSAIREIEDYMAG